jgi:hypothetical protein
VSNIPQPSPPRHRNEVLLLGSLVKQPELRTTSTGKQVANLILLTAISADRKQYHRCVLWQGLGKKVESLKVGDLLEVKAVSKPDRGMTSKPAGSDTSAKWSPRQYEAGSH